MTQHHYWTHLFTYWTVVGSFLYFLCLWETIHRKSTEWGAAGAAMGMLGGMPVFVWSTTFFTIDQMGWVVALSAGWASIPCVPLYFAMRAQSAKRKALRRAEADAAEQWIRKFGA